MTLEEGVPVREEPGLPRAARRRPAASSWKLAHHLDYRQIALLASVGQARVAVYRKPRVAILSTGDEVVALDATPEPFQIRNSNAYSLAAQVRRRGGEPVVLPVAPDQPARTRELIEQGLRADLLLLSGGVSMGKYDVVEQVLQELGAEFFFTQVAIQPGKPLVFGQVGSKPVFGLPGNPISTMVTFEVFARIALDRLAGRPASPLPFVQARLGSDFQHKPVLTRFLPAVLEGEYGEATVNPVKWQGSGDLVAAAQANCFPGGRRRDGQAGRRASGSRSCREQAVSLSTRAAPSGWSTSASKPSSRRTARAHAFVKLSAAVLARLPENPKGNPLEIARIAGIQGAKRTSELIPLCHPLPLTHVDVEIEVAGKRR